MRCRLSLSNSLAECGSGGERERIRRNDTLDRAVRRGERGLSALFVERQAFGVDELEILDADEPEELAHEAGLEIERRSQIATAACREYVRLLAGQQPHRALF